MDYEERIKTLARNPVELRFQEIESILSYGGYRLVNSKGSHFHFKKAYQPSVTIVVHNKKVKKWYVKDVCKILLSQL